VLAIGVSNTVANAATRKSRLAAAKQDSAALRWQRTESGRRGGLARLPRRRRARKFRI